MDMDTKPGKAEAKPAEAKPIEAKPDPVKERQAFHADLRKHIAQANGEQNDSAPPHPTMGEHAELRGYAMIDVLDPQTMQKVKRPCWQMAALAAHFHGHGLRHDSRISHEMFEKALDEALHGRI